MHGIVNIYKPCGISSNYVLSNLKKNLNIKKLGHLGTLDPLACGVLPVMINKGTKLFDFYLNKNKVYRAVFTFGKETDTLDSEGKVIKTCDKIPSICEIEKAIKKLTGKINQIPPNFSAKNINGKRAYDLARKGEQFELKPKIIEIESFKLIHQINQNSFLFEIKCSSGTYIRSLARDLGNLINSNAFMSALIRTCSGNFDILSATYYKDLTKDNIFDKIIGLETLLESQNKIVLEDCCLKQVTNGVKIHINHKDAKNLIVYCNNKLIGIGEICDKTLKIKTNLQV